MDAIKTETYEKELVVERAMLMLPLNVIVMGRVNGEATEEDIQSAIQSVSDKHPLLRVRVETDEESQARFTSAGVPEAEVRFDQRHGLDQWHTVAEKLYQEPFDFERGPLVRYQVLKDENGFDLLICAHHIICDGTSMTYLVKDILATVSTSEKVVYAQVIPPEITIETAENPPEFKGIVKAIMGLINKIWRKKQFRFGLGDFGRLNETYWKKNIGMRVLSSELSVEETTALAERCRAEGVTVNTALWTAFLMTQNEVQGNRPKFRNQAGLAVSVRNKLKVNVGQAFGFYASSLPLRLKLKKGQSFWDQTRLFHAMIKKGQSKKNPFAMLISSLIDPGLIDSLYFSKYGLFDSKLSKKFLGKMAWDKVNYGYSITNVGRVDIDNTYGDLKLDVVYGPLVYSDVNEKTVGVTTVGGKMTFVMTHNLDEVSEETAEQIQTQSVRTLLDAVK